MSSFRIYLVLFTAVFVATLTVLPAVNYTIDRWRVFSGYERVYLIEEKPEERINANYWLVHNQINAADPPENVFFGSSKVRNGISQIDIEKKLKGRWQKIAISGGVVDEHYQNFETLLTYGVIPERIIVSLDDMGIYGYRDSTKSYNLKPHPNTLREWIDFLRFYLFRKLDMTDLRILTGTYPLVESDYLLVEDIDTDTKFKTFQADDLQHREKMMRRAPHWWNIWKRKKYMNNEVALLAEMIRLCDEYNIEVEVLFTPSWFSTFYARDFNAIEEYKRRVAAITPFYDFATTDEVTFAPEYWEEALHYTQDMGRIILNGLTAPKQDSSSNGFGSYVTAENAETHLAKVRAHVKSTIPKALMLKPDLYLNDSYLNTITALPITENLTILDGGSFIIDRSATTLRKAGRSATVTIRYQPKMTDSAVRLEFNSARPGTLTLLDSPNNSWAYRIRKGFNSTLIPVSLLAQNVRFQLDTRARSLKNFRMSAVTF